MKEILMILFTGITLAAKSQIVINLQLAPQGITIKHQLWNLSLVNAFSEPTLVQLEMTMTDVANGQRVLSGASKPFTVNRGAKLIQPADVMHVLYTLGSSGYNVDANPDGFLPIGVFNICFVVTRYNGEVVQQIAEECEVIEIEPISPPQLVQPANNECVEQERPLFTWLAPAPFNLFSQLTFDWAIVEVMGTQTSSDAIVQNPPIFSMQHITVTNFQYPLSAPRLDTSKVYAWRVTAKNSVAPVANSEVWTIKLNCAKDDRIVEKPMPYLKVIREQGASLGIFSGIMKFEYLNELNDSAVHVSVTDITEAIHKPVALDASYIKLHYGSNLINLDISPRKRLTDRHTYLLELTNSRKEKWYLKLEYRKP